MITGEKQFMEFMEKQKAENTIGRMIAELEADLEACREADQIIASWKFLYESAKTDERRKELVKEMLFKMGFDHNQATQMLAPTKTDK